MPNDCPDLSSLLLLRVCLRVLERESACSLVRTGLAANPAIATSKQDAPQRNGAEETASNCAESEREDANFGPHGIAVEGKSSMEEGGNCKCR